MKEKRKNRDQGSGAREQYFGSKTNLINIKKRLRIDTYSLFPVPCSLFSVFRPLAIFFLLVMLAAPTYGQLLEEQRQMRTPPWWLILEQGKLQFRSGDYGGALLFFEDARRARKDSYDQMERDLIHLLSQNNVRRIGDALDRVEQFAKDMYYNAAVAAIEEVYYRVPKSTINNSANKALEMIGKLKDYPEAEYWIGEVYRVEGEFPLALMQYSKALSARDNLEDPGFAAAIQYKIGNLLLTNQDYNEMERTYLSIINERDTLWINSREAEAARTNNANRQAEGLVFPPVPYTQASASFASNAMTRTLENDGMGRFLEMYRYNNIMVENAHRQLGFFYAVTGRPTAQQHLMFSFLIQNTVILEEIKRRQFDFTLADPNPPRRPRPSARELLLIGEEINRSQVLSGYAEEVEYYKTAYYLAASLYRNASGISQDNRAVIARTIWEFLAEQPQAGEWQARAVQQLRNPRMEPLVEFP